jgi:hypothetical protein
MCISPYIVNHEIGEVKVMCGKCPKCKERRVNDWVFRLLKEEKRSISSLFITLTYDNYHVPITGNGFMTLHKRDLQLFWKRLRKKQGTPIKYYAVGEYGSLERPHYHAIVFNVENKDHIYNSWKSEGKCIGSIHIGDVSSDSIAYTCKYIDKGCSIPKHKRDDRVKSFSTMSNHIGDNYIYVTDENGLYIYDIKTRDKILRKDVLDFHTQTDKNYVYVNGYKKALPRYYRDILFNDDVKSRKLKHIIKKKIEESEEEASLLRKKGYIYSDYKRDQAIYIHKSFNKKIKNKRHVKKISKE